MEAQWLFSAREYFRQSSREKEKERESHDCHGKNACRLLGEETWGWCDLNGWAYNERQGHKEKTEKNPLRSRNRAHRQESACVFCMKRAVFNEVLVVFWRHPSVDCRVSKVGSWKLMGGCFNSGSQRWWVFGWDRGGSDGSSDKVAESCIYISKVDQMSKWTTHDRERNEVGNKNWKSYEDPAR